MKRVLVVLMFVAGLVTVRPASALDFKATFGSIKLTARPGQIITTKFSLTLDPKEQPTRFHAVVEDWWPSADGHQSNYAPAGTLERSCGPWVVLNPVDADIDGGQTLTVRLTISVSPNAKPGGYWCVLTLNEVPTPTARMDTSGVRFKASVSTGVFINIGQVERRIAILGIEHQADGATVDVENTGNVPLTVKGQIEYRRRGQEKPVLTVPVAAGPLMTERMVQGTFRAPFTPGMQLPAGDYDARAVLDIGTEAYIAAEAEVHVATAVAVPDVSRSHGVPR